MVTNSAASLILKFETSNATKNQSGRDAIFILILAALLLLAYTGIVTLTGASAELAESNLQANLIRITQYLGQGKPSDVLIGSSVAGRLLPAYFSEAGAGDISNLGLDGSRPLFAFEVLKKKSVIPKRILLDTSTLFQPISANDATIREAMNSPTTSLATILPILRPDYRPSSILYSKLKTIKEAKIRGVRSFPEAVHPEENFAGQPSTYSLVRNAVASLQKQGTEVVLVEIPHGEGWGLQASGPARALANELQLTFVEPGPDIFRREGNILSFSDGFHLDVPSARKVTHTIVRLFGSNHD